MLFLVVLVLLVLVVFLVVGRQSTSVQKRRSGPWQQDDNSDLSVLSIAPPHDIPQTPPVHEASYVDTSTGNYANDHVNSGVSAGNVDYGSSGDSSGALGSGLADAIDWGSNSSSFDSSSSCDSGGTTSDGSSG